MKWTKQQPSKPGWYWLRYPNKYGPDENIVLVEQHSRYELELLFYEGDSVRYMDWPMFADADWSDEPIPEPEA